MSIQTELEDLATNLAATKAAVVAKGGQVGETGFAGLAAEIETIPEGGSDIPETDWGVVEGYSKTAKNSYKAGGETYGCTVNSIDNPTLDAFFKEHGIEFDPDWDMGKVFRYENNVWRIYGYLPTTGYVEIAPENMVETTGINVTIWPDDPWEIMIQIEQIEGPDRTSEYVSIELTESQASGFNWPLTDGVKTIPWKGVIKFVLGHNNTTLPNSFSETPIEEIDATYGDSFTTIGNYNLYMCSQLKSINFPKVTTIGNYFLGISGFEGEINLPEVTTIGNNFLYQCASFNSPLVFPKLQTVGDDFMNGCSSFNQPVVFSSQLQTIGRAFLNGCSSFNQPVAFSAGLTAIPDSFLSGCSSFNQPISIGANVTAIGDSFLSGCTSFNQKLILPDSITSIGVMFLSACRAFNQDITIPKNAVFKAFSGATSLFRNMDSMTGTIDVQSVAPPATDGYPAYPFSVTDSTVPAYATGITIKGANRNAWLTKYRNSTSSPYRKLIDAGV